MTIPAAYKAIAIFSQNKTSHVTRAIFTCAVLSALTMPHVATAATIAIPGLVESSGICPSHKYSGVYFSHNDSQSRSIIYAFDTAGNNKGTITLTRGGAAFTPADAEDISSAIIGTKKYIALGDVGSYHHNSNAYAIYVIEEPALGAQGIFNVAVQPTVISFSYDDGMHNCEAMALCPNGDILLTAKEESGNANDTFVSKFYKITRPSLTSNSSVVAHRIATTNNKTKTITAMNVSTDGMSCVTFAGYVRTAYLYKKSHAAEDWSVALTRAPSSFGTPATSVGKMESICFSADQRTFYYTCELPGDSPGTASVGYTPLISSSVPGGSPPPPLVNHAPTVNAGNNATITRTSSSVTAALAGIVSDSDGDTTTKLWTKVSGPAAVVFSTANQATTNATFTTPGDYVLRLTASDGKAPSVSDDVIISVKLPVINVAPVVNAGSNKSAALSATNSVIVSLTGSVTDADNDVTTKLWTKVSGPSTAVTLSAATQAITNATFTAAGSYVLRLTANDGHGHTVTSDVTVVITPYAPFVRRINLNGSASSIGTNAWMAYTTALSQGLSIVPAPLLANSALTPSPVVDTNTKAMLNSAIWNSTSFTVNQTLPNGNYNVSLWVMENFYETKLRSFNVSMEGKPTGTGLGYGLAKGAWKKYTYTTTVSDGQLNISLLKVTNEPGIMGLEIVSVIGIAALTHPSDLFASWMAENK